jgi:hypothetical protein
MSTLLAFNVNLTVIHSQIGSTITLVVVTSHWLLIVNNDYTFSFCRQFTPGPVATGYRLLYLNYGLLDMSLLLWYRN